MLDLLIQLRQRQNSHHLSLYPSGIVFTQSTAKDCYGHMTKGGHISIQSQLLPGALHSSARWQLNEPNRQPWNYPISCCLEDFRKKRREGMVIRDKWEGLCETEVWSDWGRKSSPYLSQNFSTLFKVLINVLNPSKPNLFQISHKSIFSPALEACYVCLSTPWMLNSDFLTG